MVINNCLCSQEAKLCFDESSLKEKKAIFLCFTTNARLCWQSRFQEGEKLQEESMEKEGFLSFSSKFSISQVPPHFVDPGRTIGYCTFQVLCNSSAHPAWICPWNHHQLLQHIPHVNFIHLHPLKFKKNPSIQEENPAKICTIPLCRHNSKCWNIFSWITGNGKFAFLKNFI